jgi:hypothetical protein
MLGITRNVVAGDQECVSLQDLPYQACRSGDVPLCAHSGPEGFCLVVLRRAARRRFGADPAALPWPRKAASHCLHWFGRKTLGLCPARELAWFRQLHRGVAGQAESAQMRAQGFWPTSMMNVQAVEGKPTEHPGGMGGGRMHGAVLPFQSSSVGTAGRQPADGLLMAIAAEDECKRLQI